MTRFLIRRLAFLVMSVFAATFIVFGLSHLGPSPVELYMPQGGFGLPQEQIDIQIKKLNLDRPFLVQYVLWLGKLLKGDFGTSLGQLKPVTSVLAGKWGATLQLALGGWIVAIGFGVPLGVLAAVKRGSVFDYIGRGFALFGQALPSFWVGVMLILIFSIKMNGFLPAGTRPAEFSLKHFILPTITLGWPAAAGIMRLTRSSMLEILDSEYIKFARAKGVREWVVIWKHAFKNAIIVPLTSALVLLALFINGSLVVEMVFSWPGIGFVALSRAVFDNDFPLLMGVVFFYVFMFLLMAMLADILYAVIDPRIRYD